MENPPIEQELYLTWVVDMQDQFYLQWQKVYCYGNNILWAKNGGKYCIANCLAHLLPCGGDVLDTFQYYRKCVTMVMEQCSET